MLLSQLAHGFTIDGADRDVTSVTEDSRKVTGGALFVAIAGHAEDGHDYIADAVRRGAAAVVAERGGGIPRSVACIVTGDTRAALATLAARFYGDPARGLALIGFTGTFGKTSTSEVLRALLAAGNVQAGVLGSLGARFADFLDEGTGLTTPAPVELHRALRGLREAGASTVIMEVTSHALRMRRVEGLTFAGGLLAAIMPGEHTDFHRTFEDYLDAKRVFLHYLAADALLAYDGDNPGARQLAAARGGPHLAGFSIDGRPADLELLEARLDAAGAHFVLDGRLAGGRHRMTSALLGGGHLRNVALALTYALAAGVDVATASDVLRTLQPLRRRMERYLVDGRTVLDDTAAHPDSLRAVFAVAAALPRERMVVIYALRGNRGIDINARNAEALAGLALEYRPDAVIVTSSSDATSPVDRVAGAEAEAARGVLDRRGAGCTAHERLRDAIEDALARTRAGDLIVLIGAQGMNQGKALLVSSAGAAERT